MGGSIVDPGLGRGLQQDYSNTNTHAVECSVNDASLIAPTAEPTSPQNTHHPPPPHPIFQTTPTHTHTFHPRVCVI